MVDNSNGGSGSRKGRRGGKKRAGGNKGRVEDTGGSNDGPQQQTKQLKQQQRFPVVADPRFASMHSAPNFRRSKPDERKVKLDDRFKAVLTDPRFRVSDAKVDKYGRKVKKASRAAEDQLRAFYKVDEEENDGEEESSEEEERRHVVGREEKREEAGGLDEEGNDDDGEANDDEEEDGLGVVGGEGLEKGAPSRSPVEAESRQAYLTKLSRGEISVSDSSSEDEGGDGGAHSDSEDSEAGSSADDDLSPGGRRGTQAAEVAETPMSEETSRRLAVTNCDWDHMRARDIMVLCGSFCPGNARLSSVTVYPSDFGLGMMKLETAAGPHAALAEGKLLAHEDASDSADTGDSSTDEDEDGQQMEDDEQGQEDKVDVELGGVSTAAGVAVDGKVVRRRRPGVIIEEYRANSSSGEEEEEGEEEGAGRRSRELQSLEGGHRGGGDSFDPEKLRAYELRKLQYYFAVLEFSSAAAAETIYKEVDGMEFERSAVALDLRFVPDGVSFDGREARDSCTSIPSSYQPPSFICKALQQTKVECTWDEVPTERQVLLGRMSQWRDAAEGDFEAYLATSSEESDDDESTDEDDKAVDGDGDDGSRIGDDGNKNNSTVSKIQEKDAKEKKKKLSSAAARRARRLLLQDVLESDEGSGEEEDEDEEEEENKAFSSTESDYDDQEREETEEKEDGNAEFTFVSRGTAGAGDDQDGREGGVEALLERRKQRDALAKETPWEASLRKERERKRARKKAFKEKLLLIDQGDEDVGAGAADDDDFFLEEASSGRAGKISKELGGKKGRNPDDENDIWNSSASARGAAKEDEDEEERRDYDMHGLVREEKMRGKKLKGKRKRKEMAREKVPGQDFTVDVKDERFAAVLEGDTRFGIDRTDSSFKDTEGMRQILGERARRRDRRHANPTEASSVLRGEAPPSNGINGTAGEGSKDRGDLSSLVSKLKTRGIESRGYGRRVAAKADTASSRVDGGHSSAVRAGVGDVSVGGAGKGRRGKKKRRKG